MEDTLHDRPSVAEAIGIARLSPLLTKDLGRLIGSGTFGAAFTTLDERAVIKVTTSHNEMRWASWLSRCRDPIVMNAFPWCEEPVIIDGVGKVAAYRREFLLPLRSDQRALLNKHGTFRACFDQGTLLERYGPCHTWGKIDVTLYAAVMHLYHTYRIITTDGKPENFGTRADGSIVLFDSEPVFPEDS
jgi:hypothetical protein